VITDPQDHLLLSYLYQIFDKIQKERGDFVRLDYPDTPSEKV
jgi:hypothetical protein